MILSSRYRIRITNHLEAVSRLLGDSEKSANKKSAALVRTASSNSDQPSLFSISILRPPPVRNVVCYKQASGAS